MIQPVLILPGLYISGIDGLDFLDQLGISHILSVINQDISDKCENYTWKQIYIEDTWGAFIIHHLNDAYEFIHNAINSNHKVLVHCFAGASRSATIVCAYLMKNEKLKSKEALKKLKSIYPHASPNASFKRQLDIYHESNYEIKENNIELKLFKTKINLINWALGDVEFDEVTKPVIIEKDKEILFRCKKCNRLLATTKNLVHSWPIDFDEREDGNKGKSDRKEANSIFVEPLVWMKDQIQDLKSKGKLYCPNCKEKLGFFDWSGFYKLGQAQFVPGMKLHLTKLDVMEVSNLISGNIENSIRKPKLI